MEFARILKSDSVVAPHGGAWIEIGEGIYINMDVASLSPLTEGRGLKFFRS